MKNFILHHNPCAILPILIIAILYTLPSTTTEGKYVWKETINLELIIKYNETVGTVSLDNSNDMNPVSNYWVQELSNIQATPTTDGLILVAEEGYTLPEFITLTIGQTISNIKTDGTNAPEGIIFDPESGLLSIQQSLFYNKPSEVIVSAIAIQKQSLDETIPNMEQELVDKNEYTEDNETMNYDEYFVETETEDIDGFSSENIVSNDNEHVTEQVYSDSNKQISEQETISENCPMDDYNSTNSNEHVDDILP